MTTLVILTTTQIQNYIAGLDLTQGTEAYNTLNALLLLPPTDFVRAVSALSGGLIAFSDLRALPAMNSALVETLINGRLADTDPSSLTYNYAKVWLPASIDLPSLRTNAMGSVSTYLNARFYDFWGSVIQPNYDFTGSTPTSYSSYAEAYAAYIAAANSSEAQAAVATFQAAHAQLRTDYPNLLQSTDAECPVLQAVLSLLNTAYFLEQPGGGRAPSEILDLIASAAYRFVSPTNYKKFMETVAVPAMVAAYGSDPSNTGEPGAAAVAANPANYFVPLPATGVEWALDLPRMAQVWLPSAYGLLVLNSGQLGVQISYANALVNYLDAARVALLAVKDAVFLNFPTDASQSVLSGTPIGLLLCITNP